VGIQKRWFFLENANPSAMKEGNMAVKVFIKRTCPKDNERELFRIIKDD